MWKSKTFSNFEWCGGWNNGVMGSWTTWFLDFNKRGGAKFGPFLINVVAEITELWVENSRKINCRDVTSIREGRVTRLNSLMTWLLFQFSTIVKLNKSFTLPINKTSFKRKKTERLCSSSGSGIGLIENERICWFLSVNMGQFWDNI